MLRFFIFQHEKQAAASPSIKSPTNFNLLSLRKETQLPRETTN